MTPQLIVSSADKYFLAQRADKRSLPMLLENAAQPFISYKQYYRASELVMIAGDINISVTAQCSWSDGHAPVAEAFDKLVDKAFLEAEQAEATHFSMDSFSVIFWHAVPKEFYQDYGLEINARLRRFVRSDRWM